MAKIINNADLDEAEMAKLSADHRDWIYNGLDCCVTHEIADVLISQLDNVSANTYAFSRSLQAPILEMTMRGTKIDLLQRGRALTFYEERIRGLQTNLQSIIVEGIGLPSSFNWKSPTQLVHLFYTVLGYNPVRKRNAQGRMVPTANREAMEKLSAHFYAAPICNHILKLRELEKKCQFLRTELDPDNRIRTNFNIAGTKTGRLASSISDYGTGTNVQNVDRELRRCFVADEGMKLANLDLEQADARNVGAICWNLFVESHGEKFAGAYLDACESGDLHTRVCSMAWRDLPWTGDSKSDRAVADQIAYRELSYRDLAKRLGHGTNYLGTPGTMAKHSKVQTKLISDFQDRYFSGFPSIKEWHQWVKRSLAESASITTLFGRRRFFFGRRDDAKTLRDAVAYAPQSMTADQIDTGIINIWRANKVQLLIQVHDSILFQYPEELEDEIIPWALQTLRTTIPLHKGRDFTVPTEAKVGWNWGDVEFDKQGQVINNPMGLVKWKGGDNRKPDKARTFRERLCAS